MTQPPPDPLPPSRTLGRLAAAWRGAVAQDTVRVAVTGLSGAGKTVFITALAENLRRARDRGQALPFFGPAAEGRILDVQLEVPPVHGFPVGAHAARLRGAAPAWPPSTTGISRLALVIDYRPRDTLVGTLIGALAGRARLRLEIVDYPGEWLLDIGLLGRSFADWSRAQAAADGVAPRAGLARAWRADAAAIDLAADADDDALDRVGRSYARYLAACRAAPVQLSLLQPGRYLCPGDGPPAPWFFPAEAPAGARCGPRSALAALARRYDAYVRDQAAPFYRDHFRRFDRQVVLVDVLAALNAGPAAFADMQAALREILRNFRYARDGWLARLLGGRIGTVVFAATKADHVTANQYHNLRMLLARMVEDRADIIAARGAAVRYVALAAIKSTTNVARALDGHQVSVVRGVIRGEGERRDVFPGEVPDAVPPPAEWTPRHFRFYDFQPPPLGGGDAWFRHIHLDQVLRDLLEERLR